MHKFFRMLLIFITLSSCNGQSTVMKNIVLNNTVAPYQEAFNLHENKTIYKTENSTLSKNFIFKFSISKIEDEG